MRTDALPELNLLDAALATAGSLEDLFALSLINGLAYTDVLSFNATLILTGESYVTAAKPAAPPVTQQPAAVGNAQTLPDMAVQQMGSLEGLFELAMLNGLSVTDELSAGSIIQFPVQPVSATIARLYADNGYRPASGLLTDGGLDGIDYMIIERTFIVS